MASLQRLLSRLRHWVRHVAFDDMAHQARGWVPDNLLTATKAKQKKAIDLDFAVPKKNRLNWVRRQLDQLPH